MNEGMGNCTVQCQLSTDSNADHHKAQLIVKAIAKHLAQIIFNDCKKYRKERHHDADADQHFGAGKSSCQGVHRKLGGERA